jgi:hypothetical protein
LGVSLHNPSNLGSWMKNRPKRLRKPHQGDPGHAKLARRQHQERVLDDELKVGLKRDFRFPVRNGSNASAHLWCIAPLLRRRFALSCFYGFAACSGAPSHCLPPRLRTTAAFKGDYSRELRLAKWSSMIN